MDDNYYSIDSILAENQKIQCTFKKEIPNMGHLEGGNERDVSTRFLFLCSRFGFVTRLPKIKPGMKAQVPIWMARTLFFSCVVLSYPYNSRYLY